MNTYIAAPFFNDMQKAVVDQIKGMCESYELKVYSPKDECLFVPGETDPRRIFLDNLKTIKNSDFLIAVTDVKDVGTLFECGYAYAIGTPIVYVWLNHGEGDKFNLMLNESGVVVCKSLYDLTSVLAKVSAWCGANPSFQRHKQKVMWKYIHSLLEEEKSGFIEEENLE